MVNIFMVNLVARLGNFTIFPIISPFLDFYPIPSTRMINHFQNVINCRESNFKEATAMVTYALPFLLYGPSIYAMAPITFVYVMSFSTIYDKLKIAPH